MTSSKGAGFSRDYWNEDGGAGWVAEQERLDMLLRPISEHLLTVAAPRAGERVIDIGCGCGSTTLELARRVGATGSALGVDISRPMLERARTIGADLPQLSFIEADAQTHPLAEATADLVMSRFGVMFFADSVAAFSNLRRAVAPGGRCVFACWQGVELNPWVGAAARDARDLLPGPQMPSQDAPGPFRFADRDRTTTMLRDAGFASVDVEPFATELSVTGTVDELVDFFFKNTPLRKVLGELKPEVREQVRQRIGTTLAADYDGSGVAYGSAVWIVRAAR